MRAYKSSTVIAAQRRVLMMAATVIRGTVPKGRRDTLHAFDGCLLTVDEVLAQIKGAQKMRVKP